MRSHLERKSDKLGHAMYKVGDFEEAEARKIEVARLDGGVHHGQERPDRHDACANTPISIPKHYPPSNPHSNRATQLLSPLYISRETAQANAVGLRLDSGGGHEPLDVTAGGGRSMSGLSLASNLVSCVRLRRESGSRARALLSMVRVAREWRRPTWSGSCWSLLCASSSVVSAVSSHSDPARTAPHRR
eukprot:1878464-Rhodomonas_salina.3